MRSMTTAMTLGLLIICSLFTVEAQEAGNSEKRGTARNDYFDMPEEKITEEPSEPVSSRKWWKDRDDDYVHTPDFKLQIARTQLAVGSILLPSGITLIGVGASRLHSNEGKRPNTEVTSDEYDSKRGRGMIIGGTITSLSGIFLIFRGHDELMQWKSAHGYTRQLTLPANGDLGLSLRF